MNYCAPTLENLDKLEFGELLSFDLILLFINIQDGSDLLLSFRIVSDLQVHVNLIKSLLYQVVYEWLSVNV